MSASRRIDSFDELRLVDTVYKIINLQLIFGGEPVTEPDNFDNPIEELRFKVATTLDDDIEVPLY